MSSTNFVDLVGPPVNAAWLNDVNKVAYNKTFPDGTVALSAAPGTSLDAQFISYEQGGTGSVSTTVTKKLQEVVSVKDFGAKGDGTTDDTTAIQNALNAVFAAGGGSVFVPAGTYIISKPVIVQSNTNFYGVGAKSIIKNNAGSFGEPNNNLIHIGYGNIWSLTGQQGVGTDATIAELLANNYSYITTYNASVRNLTVQGWGLGVFAMNAANVVIDNIWSVNTLTPVNVANDNSSQQAACINVAVSNIYQVSSIGTGDWYDLVFVGAAIKVNVSNCFNNPATPSALDGNIVFSTSQFCSVTNCNLIKSTTTYSTTNKRGIMVTSSGASDIRVENNLVTGYLDGIYVTGQNNIIAGNMIFNCYNGLTINNSLNLISGNYFLNNSSSDASGSTAMKQNSFVGNYNLTKTFVSGYAFDPQQYNTFTGNTVTSYIQQNFNTWPSLKGRYISYFPLDTWLSTTDAAKVTISPGTLNFTSTAGTITAYYKLPIQVKKITNVQVNGYSYATGDSVQVNICGTDGLANSNSLPVLESLGTQTSSVSGNYTFTFTSSRAFYAQGTYYVQVIYTTSSIYSQLRDTQLITLCDD